MTLRLRKCVDSNFTKNYTILLIEQEDDDFSRADNFTWVMRVINLTLDFALNLKISTDVCYKHSSIVF